jgi:hypothetical protein
MWLYIYSTCELENLVDLLVSFFNKYNTVHHYISKKLTTTNEVGGAMVDIARRCGGWYWFDIIIGQVLESIKEFTIVWTAGQIDNPDLNGLIRSKEEQVIH